MNMMDEARKARETKRITRNKFDPKARKSESGYGFPG
jgi:hypothetical protein